MLKYEFMKHLHSLLIEFMCTDEIADGEYRLNKKTELQGNAKNYIEEDETAEENLNEYRNRRKVWHGWSQAK